MITMRIKGGLGNQLFQYSAAYALSKRLDQPFQFDPSFTANMTKRNYRLSDLNVSADSTVDDNQLSNKITLMKNPYINKICRILNLPKHKCGNTLYWLETKDEWQPDFFTIDNENIYIDGYFQSEDYFLEYRNDLLKQITPRYIGETQYFNMLEQVRVCNSVAIHARRGDFKIDNSSFHYLLTENYYINAIQYIRKHITHPVFFWFSDDMRWVKEHVGISSDFRYVNLATGHCDIDEMMLMKNCSQIITANSTFSWWAAWLNEHEDAIRICPAKRYGNKEMIPESWIKVKVE